MTQSPFYSHLAAFRGLAIITIVAAHSWSFSLFWTGGLNGQWLPELFWTTEVLFHGSTLYFAVLSGLLYSLVLQKKSWRGFFQSKALNVALPYVILSIFTTVFYWPWGAASQPEVSIWTAIGMNILTGNAMIHFWYILVLFFLFAITPLLSACFRQPGGQWVCIILALLPLCISRSPFPDFLKPQSFVYFSGAYALGMLWGHHYQTFQKALITYRLSLIVIAILTSVGMWLTYYFDMPQEGTFSLRQSFVYLQKIAIMAIVVPWLANRTQPRWLLRLGEFSFAVYFLHTFFIGAIIINAIDWLTANRDPLSIGIMGMANLIAGVGCAFIVAWLLKKLLGKHARKLVGA